MEPNPRTEHSLPPWPPRHLSLWLVLHKKLDFFFPISQQNMFLRTFRKIQGKKENFKTSIILILLPGVIMSFGILS